MSTLYALARTVGMLAFLGLLVILAERVVGVVKSTVTR